MACGREATMSAARDLFAELFTHRPMLRPGDREAVETLRKAADQWRADGRFFSAGVCMSVAMHGAWGDGVEVDRCLVRALEDYKTCVDTQPRNSLECDSCKCDSFACYSAGQEKSADTF